ncbi:MAG: hypothetical protein ACLQE9_12525 [Roseiarcus sp.]
MAIPTVAECAGLSGATRALLHEFDQLLRDALHATQHKARALDLQDRQVETACVTVMMTVAAGAALAALESPAEVDDAIFSAAARDALIWARRRANVPAVRRR